MSLKALEDHYSFKPDLADSQLLSEISSNIELSRHIYLVCISRFVNYRAMPCCRDSIPFAKMYNCLSNQSRDRGSYMSAHVLLNLLNELEKEIKCEACRAFYLFFGNEFNKFNNVRARMLDFIYHMTLRLL